MIQDCRMHVHFVADALLAPMALFLAYSVLWQSPRHRPLFRLVEANRKSASRRHAAASISSAFRHPLDPLEPAEIEFAVASIRKRRRLADTVRFVTICLNEPSKAVVRQSQSSSGGSLPARRS